MGVTAQTPQPIAGHHHHPHMEGANNNGKSAVLRHNAINSTLSARAALYEAPPAPHAADRCRIADFYRGLNVLITGGTGFVGKAVLEKLLRTCDGIGSVYVLIRAKRGVDAAGRLREMFANPLFDKIKAQDEALLRKIVPIEGDVALPLLGIGEADRRRLVEHVHVVFHSAATVRFCEPLRTAILLNTLGTKRVLELATEMKGLLSYVHVSTAYCNSGGEACLREVVYAPPADPHCMIRCAETLSDEALAQLEKVVLAGHPNSYTFTKALAESIVQEYVGRLAVAIVRPSIVVNAWKEPLEGWIDHSTGVPGIMLELGRGCVQTVYGDHGNRMDIVPVDFVANTLIAGAWHTVAKRCSTMRIYNCTSGHENAVTWGAISEMTVAAARKYPTMYLTWYPQVVFTRSRLLFRLIQVFLQRAPALVTDLFLVCTLRKPIMYHLAKRLERNLKVGEFFVNARFMFGARNLAELQTDVRAAADGDSFPLDISAPHMNWSRYCELCVLGLRRFVLKDDLSSLPQARRRLNGYYLLKRILQLISLCVLLKMTVW